MAVISLLLAPVLICPSVTPAPQCQAVTRCTCPSSVVEPRSVLPSTAMCACSRLGHRLAIQRRKHASKRLASSIANTRLKVSCEAMPRSNGRKRRSHASLNSPHSATSTQSSAPAETAHNAVNSSSCSGYWKRPACLRGSSRSSKACTTPRVGSMSVTGLFCCSGPLSPAFYLTDRALGLMQSPWPMYKPKSQRDP